MLTNAQLGERIKLFRESYNLSQYRLGKSIKTHKNTICHWEQGKQKPFKAKLERLCEAYGVPMHWFTMTEAELKALKEGGTGLFNPVIKEGDITFNADGVMVYAKATVTTHDKPASIKLQPMSNITDIKRDKPLAEHDNNKKFMELYLKLSPHSQGRMHGYMDALLRDELKAV